MLVTNFAPVSVSSYFSNLLIHSYPAGVDFIKQFTPYAWNLHSAPNFFPKLASCICALCPTYCIFYLIWVCFTLYAVRTTFMKSISGMHQPSYVAELKDSEHAPTLFFSISGIEHVCFCAHFLDLNFLPVIVLVSLVLLRQSNCDAFLPSKSLLMSRIRVRHKG